MVIPKYIFLILGDQAKSGPLSCCTKPLRKDFTPDFYCGTGISDLVKGLLDSSIFSTVDSDGLSLWVQGRAAGDRRGLKMPLSEVNTPALAVPIKAMKAEAMPYSVPYILCI